MEYIAGSSREQTILFPELVDDYINAENPIRFLDEFVEQLDIYSMGFKYAKIKETGRPPYNPKDHLKLNLYGYLNKIRSSRNLEREAGRNVEVMWLLKKLIPDHKTISNFRKDNTEAIRKVFKEFIQLCKKLDLFSAELIAVDSTKFKASNSRAMVKDKEQLEKSIDRIDESITEYFKKLEENDQKEDAENQSSNSTITKEELKEKISFLKKVKEKLKDAKEEIQKSGEEYVSLTDSDCRLMNNKGKIEPGYNVHTAVDSKYSLIIDYEVSQNASDKDHLSSMAIAAKETLEVDEINACADAGYYDTVDIKNCEDNGITPYVSIPEQGVPKKTNVPEPEYKHDKFTYDEQTDSYQCPEGHRLNYYCTSKNKKGKRNRIYKTKACRGCPSERSFGKAKLCTTSPKGRQILRWENEKSIELLKQRLKAEPEIIKKRKSIVEHPFGTMKGVWGYSHFLLRGVEKVTAEISLMTLAYNIRRVITIIGVAGLLKALNS
jgi:transposase